MREVFDLSKLDEYREDNRREVRKQAPVCRFLSQIQSIIPRK